MHNAPPVVYPLGRSGFQAALLCAVWFSGLLSVVVWWWVLRRFDWRLMLGMTAVMFAGAGALSNWKNSPTGQLSWDGQAWSWQSRGYQTGTAVSKLSVLADFQSFLLLRIENQASATLWLWARKHSFPERWLDLRRAIFARAGTASVDWPKFSTPAEMDDVFPVAVSVAPASKAAPPQS